MLRIRYAEVVGADVSVGVGTRLSEADKALLAAKLKGGNQIVLYSPDLDPMLEAAPKQTESEKIHDEYLDKAEPAKPESQEALNTPSAGGGMQGPSRAGPAGPDAEASEHSENESLNSMIEDAGQDLHAQLGGMADQQGSADDQEADQEQSQQESNDEQDKLKKQLVGILKVWQDRAKELEALADQDPDLYQSLVGMMKALITMSKSYFGDPGDAQGGDIQKSEGECKHFFVNRSPAALGGKRCIKCKATKEDLDKAALEAGKTGRHNVILPVGSQKDGSASGTQEAGKLKTQDPESGKTKWRSVRAGLVMDPQGQPVSSRNPGGNK